MFAWLEGYRRSRQQLVYNNTTVRAQGALDNLSALKLNGDYYDKLHDKLSDALGAHADATKTYREALLGGDAKEIQQAKIAADKAHGAVKESVSQAKSFIKQSRSFARGAFWGRIGAARGVGYGILGLVGIGTAAAVASSVRGGSERASRTQLRETGAYEPPMVPMPVAASPVMFDPGLATGADTLMGMPKVEGMHAMRIKGERGGAMGAGFAAAMSNPSLPQFADGENVQDLRAPAM